MKKTYIVGILSVMSVAGMIACNNGGSSNTAPMVHHPGGLNPNGIGSGPGIKTDTNGAVIASGADDIVFKEKNVKYNPTDYRHVVNPAVSPNVTGYSASDNYQFTDAANDKLMAYLREYLERDRTEDQKKGDNSLAQDISMAEMRRTSNGHLEFHVWTQEDQEIILTTATAIAEKEESTDKDTKKVLNRTPLETEDENYKLGSTSHCLTKDSDKKCQTVVLQLVRKGIDQALIVFRTVPATLELGEYTSRLLGRFQMDSIIDQWVNFLFDLKTYPQTKIKSTFTDPQAVTELKTFAVANGISAFTLTLNQSLEGRFHDKFILSGELATSFKNASESLDLPLKKGVLSGAEDQTLDPIAQTVSDSTLMHANGRGMLHIRLQLKKPGFLANEPDPEVGGVRYNEKGLEQSTGGKNLFYQNMMARLNYANRNKSLRLQNKSNRAIRFTVIPSVADVFMPHLEGNFNLTDEKK